MKGISFIPRPSEGFSGAYADLTGKPSLGTAAALNIGGGGAANEVPYFPTAPATATGLIGNAGGGSIYGVSVSSELEISANVLGIKSGIIPLQSETKSYLAGVIAAGGTVSAKRLVAFDELVATAKAQNWWTKLLEVYPFITDGFAGVFVKAKAASGAPASLTNNNFVAADYSPEGGFGVNASNSTKWLQSGFIPSTLGYTQANIGIICAPCSDQITAGGASGRTWGDMITGNAAECGIFFQHSSTNIVAGNTAYSWQALNPTPRVVSFQSSGSLHHTCTDGVQITSWAQVSSGTLTGEITGWRVTRYGAARYDNGRVGMTMITAYMTPTEAKQATLAVAQFERKVRSWYRSGEPGIIWHGDSIAAGVGGALTVDSFAPTVSRKAGLRQVQFGNQSAWLTADPGPIGGVNTISSILANCPEGEIWSIFGSNDVQYSVTDTTYGTAINTLAAAIKTALRRGGIGTPPMSTNSTHQTTLRLYAAKCAIAAVANGLAFADLNIAMVDALAAGTTVNSDTVHPNAAGLALIAKVLLLARQDIQWRAPILNFPSIAAGSYGDLTVTMLTVRVGNRVLVNPFVGVDPSLQFSAWVSADDTVTIRAFNPNAVTAIDPDTGQFQIQVWT